MKTKMLFALSISVLMALSSLAALQGADFAVYTGSGTWDEGITAFENFLTWKGLTYEEVSSGDINNNDLLEHIKRVGKVFYKPNF